MTTLLQISDPHFGTEQQPVVEALVRLVKAQAPDLIVLSGDITQRATTAEFSAAKSFIDRLGPAPLLAIPGNHDIPLFNLALRAFAPYRRHAKVFGDELEPVIDTPEWRVIGVKTTRRWRHENGEVSQRQIEQVAQAVEAAAPGQLRVIVIHHPVAVIRRQDRENLLHGHEHAVRRWAAAGADLVMGGHIHLPYVLPLHEVHANLSRRVWAVQAGTALSHRLRHEAGNSVNLCRRQDGRSCTVERWDYGQAGHFERVLVHLLDCSEVAGASRAA